MGKVKNISDLRKILLLPRVVWGDSYGLFSLAKHFGIVFLVWSEVLVPLKRFNSGYPFISIPEPTIDLSNADLKYIFLQVTEPHTNP